MLDNPTVILRLTACAMLLACCSDAAAKSEGESEPEYTIDTWSTKQGLPQSSATAVTQSRDGYLWIATFKGLARFDGLHFKVFDRENVPEMPGSAIVNLQLDRRNRLWVSTTKGMVCLENGVWRQQTRFSTRSQVPSAEL
jgi:ligand-binding sensor domain-containing protein